MWPWAQLSNRYSSHSNGRRNAPQFVLLVQCDKVRAGFIQENKSTLTCSTRLHSSRLKTAVRMGEGTTECVGQPNVSAYKDLQSHPRRAVRNSKPTGLNFLKPHDQEAARDLAGSYGAGVSCVYWATPLPMLPASASRRKEWKGNGATITWLIWPQPSTNTENKNSWCL